MPSFLAQSSRSVWLFSSGPVGRSGPLQSFYCGAASGVVVQMGWGPAISSHLLHNLRVLPPAVGVRHCLWVLLGGSSSKGIPGGGEGRISPTRCVSSTLLCHPLNLYCSSTGSIRHIVRTLVLLGLRHVCRRAGNKTKATVTSRKTLLNARVVTLDQFQSWVLVSPLPISQCLSSV